MANTDGKSGTFAGKTIDQSISHDSTVEKVLWRRCNVAIAVILVVMFCMICMFSTFDMMGAGDSWSDINTLMAGENYAKYGFMRLYFLPVHYLGSLSETPLYYLHYPPLGEIFNGLLQSMGVRSLFVMRVIAGLFFIIGLLFMYRGIGYVTGPLAALCGIAFLGTTLYFMAYSTCIHSHAYNMFFLGIYLFLFIRAMDDRGQGKKRWILCWLILFFSSLTSFEFILYMQVFSWVYALGKGQLRKHWRVLVLLGSAPVAGVALHFIQNVWAIGWAFAVSDGFGAGYYHAGAGNERLAATIKLSVVVSGYSLKYFHLTWRCFALLTVPVYFCRKSISSRMERHGGALLLAVLAASASWYIFMPNHVLRHQHTSNQLLVLVVIVMGCTFSLGLKLIKCKNSDLLVRVLIGSVLATVLLDHAYEIRNFLSRQPSNNYRMARVLGPDALPENSSYLCSHKLRGPYTSYSLKRSVWQCDKEQLENSDFLETRQGYITKDEPIRYFLFYHEGEYLTDELFVTLASNYYGKRKQFRIPGQDVSGCLILFDMPWLLTADETGSRLPDHIVASQLRGTFADWEIPGFDERLAEEFGTGRR